MLFEENKLLLIAGPCSLENEEVTFSAAECLTALRNKFPELKLVFKGSFDEANRISIYSERGWVSRKGLDFLGRSKITITYLLLAISIYRNKQLLCQKFAMCYRFPHFYVGKRTF
jgi:3-deoxy-D-manno-octulosonic acid (KDO) 8-phosphate synthase